MRLLLLIAASVLVGCATQPSQPMTPAQLQAQSQFLHEFNQMQRPYYPAGSPSAGGMTNCFTTRTAIGYQTTCH